MKAGKGCFRQVNAQYLQILKTFVIFVFCFSPFLVFCQSQSYIYNNSFLNFTIDVDDDTLYTDTIQLHFPVVNYLDFSTDITNAYVLSCYSRTLELMQEPVMFSRSQPFLRVILLEEGQSTVYRLENNTAKYLLVVNRMAGNYSQPGELNCDSIAIDKDTFYELAGAFNPTIVWNIKPHSVDFYALDEQNIVLFESNLRGGYHFTDLHLSFVLNSKLFKDFFNALDDLKKFHNNKLVLRK